MQTLIYPAKLQTSQGRSAIQEAGTYIRLGQLVGFPTETVYGLGADALQPTAIAKIFAAKGRPNDNPLIAHICSMDMGASLGTFTPLAQKLADYFWPGPLTIVVDRSSIVPDILTAGLDSVAIRWPSHPVAQALIHAAATPIAAPSANLSGRPSPTTAAHVYEDMAQKIPFILDGGAVEIGLESTVVDARGRFPLLLRPGKITKEQLIALCGDCLEADTANAALPASPGMKYRHYAPKAQVYLAGDCQEALLISSRCSAPPLFLVSQELAETLRTAGIEQERIRALFAQNELETFAQQIFAMFRQADLADEKVLVVEKVAKLGLGKAIMNRLEKAAQG